MTILRDQTRPLRVDSESIAKHVTQELAIEAARRAALARATGSVESTRMSVPFEGGWMRIMAAVLPSLNLFGYKEFHLATGNNVRYAVHLFALSDGRPLGVVDGALVTPLRTAASAAVAAEYFFGNGAEVRLGVIGSSAEALAGVRALNSVLKLKDVRVTSRSPENRERFAKTINEELGLDIRPENSIAETLKGVDMVYVATNSNGKVVVELKDLRDIPFVASIGSTTPAQRELDDDVLAGAAHVIVDTCDVLEESGDAIASAKHGLAREKVRLLGQMPQQEWNLKDGLTVYKSIGSPEQDLVLAHMILEAAAANGFGEHYPPISAIKQNL